MAGAVDNPTQGTHPAFSPPPIMPRNEFQARPDDDCTMAVQLIAEILMDDEWHHLDDIVDELEWELEYPQKAARKLMMRLQSHGDVRRDEEWFRLTTRWKGYRAPEVVNA